MDKIYDQINKILGRKPIVSIPAGMYHYQSPADAPRQYHLHLRVEPDGSGLLIVNAHTTLHLNQTATEYAYYRVQGASEENVVSQIVQRYNIKRENALQDYHDFLDKIDVVSQTEDIDPETYLGMDRYDPYSKPVSAPYRLDCALTYRMNTEAPKDTAPVDRVKRELLTEEWEQILSKAWDAGIPHIIFTGGEPTLRPDLLDLIAYCQKIGQVTGVLTDGFALTNPDYFHKLLNAGLDHLMILLDPREDQSWEAVLDVLTEDIFVTVHMTIASENNDEPYMVMDRLAKMGVKSISLSGAQPHLDPIVKKCGEYAAQKGLSLAWDLPVPYSTFHPVALELAEQKAVSGAGKAWLYLEPDGDILPAQGINRVLGNMLNDPWDAIWNNPARTAE
jgi:hypothetical protein